MIEIFCISAAWSIWVYNKQGMPAVLLNCKIKIIPVKAGKYTDGLFGGWVLAHFKI